VNYEDIEDEKYRPDYNQPFGDNDDLDPPRVDHLDVVGRLTPSIKWKPRIHNAPLTFVPGGSASNETCARCHCSLN
jgi:hypothetical protein